MCVADNPPPRPHHRLLSRINARFPRRGVTSLHGLCCLMVPRLPFSSMMGSVRGGSWPYMWSALPSMLAQLREWAAQLCGNGVRKYLRIFKREGLWYVSSSHVVANRTGRTPLAGIRMCVSVSTCFMWVAATLANTEFPHDFPGDERGVCEWMYWLGWSWIGITGAQTWTGKGKGAALSRCALFIAGFDADWTDIDADEPFIRI